MFQDAPIGLPHMMDPKASPVLGLKTLLQSGQAADAADGLAVEAASAARSSAASVTRSSAATVTRSSAGAALVAASVVLTCMAAEINCNTSLKSVA